MIQVSGTVSICDLNGVLLRVEDLAGGMPRATFATCQKQKDACVAIHPWDNMDRTVTGNLKERPSFGWAFLFSVSPSYSSLWRKNSQSIYFFATPDSPELPL